MLVGLDRGELTMRNAFGLVLAIVAAPAIAASTPTGVSGTTTRGPSADGNKIVCKGKPTTGTRFSKSRCLTKAQWEAIAEQQRREAEEMFNKPTINPPGD
jgi:hypothetical protein